MAEYILFEKRSENERPACNAEMVKTFCEDHEISPISITDESIFIVVKLADHKEEDKHRLVQITETIAFLLPDDPSLDEFLEAELPPPPKLEREPTVESP